MQYLVNYLLELFVTNCQSVTRTVLTFTFSSSPGVYPVLNPVAWAYVSKVWSRQMDTSQIQPDPNKGILLESADKLKSVYRKGKQSNELPGLLILS